MHSLSLFFFIFPISIMNKALISIFHSKTILTAYLSIILSAGVWTQNKSLLLDDIMRGNDYVGNQPTNFVWDETGEHIYFRWNPNNELIDEYYDYTVSTKKLEKAVLDINSPISLNGMIDATESSSGYFKIGHHLYSTYQGKSKKIYTNTSSYQILKIHQDHIYFEQGKNIYCFSPAMGTLIQLTNFILDAEPSIRSTTPLEEVEQELFSTLRDNKAKEYASKHYNDNINLAGSPRPFYLNGYSPDEISISDQANYVAFVGLKRVVENDPTFYMNYITQNGYARAEVARPKVGMNLDDYSLFVFDRMEDTTVEYTFTALSDLNRIPDFYQNYPDTYPKSYSKKLIFHLHGFNTIESRLLVEIKSQDNKDRWIGYIDLKLHKFIETHHQHDEAWIGGPGIVSWNTVPGTVNWTSNETFYFQDEKTGYSHLYLYTIPTKSTIPLTSGAFEIHDVILSKNKKELYITANKNHPGNREFYKLSLSTQKLTPLLTEDGNHIVILSPDEKQFLVSYSYKNKPWELYIAKNEEHSTLEQITHSESDEFKSYPWRAPDVISFNASDGQVVNARIYEPTPDKKNQAAILFVHGAGYLQNAHNWWSTYYREYMFHNLLCDLGYTVLDVDYRASEGYGRDFRTAIYRHMGGKDLSDFVDARSFLINEKGIDSSRIGIYGGSYGGFITLMALLTEPGKFKCGAAIRSVTDWAHYNHPYTANILNSPKDDPLAYKKSSPIYFAENLDDQLLMLHGMVDNNVHYQDVVRLSQRFIELGRKKWDLIGYPVEPHGFKESTSWVDEYSRILNLFNEELLN